MRRLFPYVVIFLVTLAVGHYGVLHLTPGIIMDQAISRIEARGIQAGKFVLTPKLTPETQSVVRPSPDLAYSICLFDFGENPEPLNVRAAPWQDYGSVSFFDARTNNFAAFRVAEGINAAPLDIILLPPGKQRGTLPDQANTNTQIIDAPTTRGIILVRRLAPSDEAYEAVSELAKGDVCGPVISGTGS